MERTETHNMESEAPKKFILHIKVVFDAQNIIDANAKVIAFFKTLDIEKFQEYPIVSYDVDWL